MKKKIIVFIISFCTFITLLFLGRVENLLIIFDENNPWYENSNTIIHAGGTINYEIHTNSKEAIESSLSKFNKEDFILMELDFNFTKDNALVLNHKWSDMNLSFVPTFDEFKSKKSNITYISFEDIFCYLEYFENLHIIVDTKVEDYLDKSIVDICNYILVSIDESFIDRFIYEAYEVSQIEELKRLGIHSENIIYSLYKSNEKNVSKIIDDCKNLDIDVILFRYGAFSKESIKKFKDNDIHICVYTINDKHLKYKLLLSGYDEIITDYLF